MPLASLVAGSHPRFKLDAIGQPVAVRGNPCRPAAACKIYRVGDSSPGRGLFPERAARQRLSLSNSSWGIASASACHPSLGTASSAWSSSSASPGRSARATGSGAGSPSSTPAWGEYLLKTPLGASVHAAGAAFLI
jgi:hypothetical protein